MSAIDDLPAALYDAITDDLDNAILRIQHCLPSPDQGNPVAQLLANRIHAYFAVIDTADDGDIVLPVLRAMLECAQKMKREQDRRNRNRNRNRNR